MEETIAFVIRYGYAVLFVAVLAEQIGLPLPALPMLLAAGALAREGELGLAGVIGVAVLAAMLADLFWYAVGKHSGARVLAFLCKLSLEPDSCVRRTETSFGRHGARALLVAKFVPGLNTAAPPLAGMLGMPLARFLAFDGAGAFIWVLAFVTPGYVFADQLHLVLEWATGLGGSLFAIAVGALALYLGLKYWARWRFMHDLRVRRIDPVVLHARIEAGEHVVVVDLRHAMEVEASPQRIPGSLHIPFEDLDLRLAEIPPDREIVLYCT